MKNIGRIQKQLISDAMQQMLEDGEIDMVTSARKTPDREEKFDFSRPIGTNHGMLTVRSDNSTIVDGNYSTYTRAACGMRIYRTKDAEPLRYLSHPAGNGRLQDILCRHLLI